MSWRAGPPDAPLTDVTRFGIAVLFLLASLSAHAQKRDTVHWEAKAEPESAAPGGKFRVKLIAKSDPEWHFYSLTTPKGGGLPSQVALDANAAVANSKVFQPKPDSKFD